MRPKKRKKERYPKSTNCFKVYICIHKNTLAYNRPLSSFPLSLSTLSLSHTPASRTYLLFHLTTFSLAHKQISFHSHSLPLHLSQTFSFFLSRTFTLSLLYFLSLISMLLFSFAGSLSYVLTSLSGNHTRTSVQLQTVSVAVTLQHMFTHFAASALAAAFMLRRDSSLLMQSIRSHGD